MASWQILPVPECLDNFYLLPPTFRSDLETSLNSCTSLDLIHFARYSVEMDRAAYKLNKAMMCAISVFI